MARFTTAGGDGSGAPGPQGDIGPTGPAGAGFGIYYLGNYNPSSGYVPDIAVVMGSDGQLYLAKASGQLGDPVGNTAEWEVWIPKGTDGTNGTNGTSLTARGTWTDSENYAINDIVNFEGSSYVCIVGVTAGTDVAPYPENIGAYWQLLTSGTTLDTGQITFLGVYIMGAGAGSGDGAGNGTIKLLPDIDLVQNSGHEDQYLIIDPTSPNHIHVRAGGVQDNSGAHLIIGGERNNVEVSDPYRTVKIHTRPQTVQNSYVNANQASNTEFMLPTTESNILIGDNVYVDGNNYTVAIVTDGYPYAGLTTVVADGASFITGNSYTFTREETYNNEWTFGNNGTLYGPAMGGLRVSGIVNDENQDLWISSGADINISAIDNVASINAQDVNLNASGSVAINSDGGITVTSSTNLRLESEVGNINLYMDGAAYIGNAENDNRIVTVGDLTTSNNGLLQSVRWTPNFTATGLAFTGTGNTHPAYNSHYVKQGQLVSFWIAIDLSTVTNFGTGQLKVDLPFAPLAGTMNHFSGWVFVDETANQDLAGHIIVNADHLANTQILDLHYIKQSGGANSPVMEAMLMQNTPAVLTTLTNIYVNGTYICA